MPWIIDGIHDDSTITIDPLSILHITHNIDKKATHILMHDFARALNRGYDLQAPDFSYIMIDELLGFHQSKHMAITECKQIILHLRHLFQQFEQQIDSATKDTCMRIQLLHHNTTNLNEKNIYLTQDDFFKDAGQNAATQATALCDQFTVSKARYFSINLQAESLVAEPGRWIPLGSSHDLHRQTMDDGSLCSEFTSLNSSSSPNHD